MFHTCTPCMHPLHVHPQAAALALFHTRTAHHGLL